MSRPPSQTSCCLSTANNDTAAWYLETFRTPFTLCSFCLTHFLSSSLNVPPVSTILSLFSVREHGRPKWFRCPPISFLIEIQYTGKQRPNIIIAPIWGLFSPRESHASASTVARSCGAYLFTASLPGSRSPIQFTSLRPSNASE